LIEEYDAGVIVPDGCPKALANAVDTILADPELWNRLSAGAMQLSYDHFDLKLMGDRLVNAYALLCENKLHNHGNFGPRGPGR
jgi:glycosyltransferase involved in cell wall biosynthesis